MKINSTQRIEEKFRINKFPQNKVEVLLFDNATLVDDVFEYDMYILNLTYRENIELDIENNFDKWIEFAKQEENKSITISDKEKIELLEKENEIILNALEELISISLGGE